MVVCKEKQTWTEALDDLEAFTAEHLDIVATPQRLAIPEPLRSPFYALVSKVQQGICTEVLGDGAKNTVEVARLCGEVKRRLVEMGGLVDFKLASAVETLISDPTAALAKPLFGMVLDLIQGRSDRAQLLEAATRTVPDYNSTLFRNAYEAWAYYSVVAALNPVHFYGVFSSDTLEAHAVSSGYVTVGSQVTSPERRIPEAVFETADGRCFAMKSEVARELDYYGAKIMRRRDSSAGGNTVDQIAHRVLLLYHIPDIDSIPLLADRDKQTVLASDLMCEVLYPLEMEQPSYVSQFVGRISTVRSKRPVQVLCFDGSGAFPEGMLEDDTVPAIDHRVVGFSEDALKDVARLLSVQSG